MATIKHYISSCIRRMIHLVKYIVSHIILAIFLTLLCLRKFVSYKSISCPSYESPGPGRFSESILIIRTKYGNSAKSIVSNEYFHMEDTLPIDTTDSCSLFFVDTGNCFFKLSKIAYLCRQKKISVIIANSVSLCESDNVHGVYILGLKIISLFFRIRISFVLWDTCSLLYTQHLHSIKLRASSGYLRYYPVDNPLCFPDIHLIDSSSYNSDMIVRGLFPLYNKDRLLPLEKSIDLSFIGQVDGYRNGRLIYISRLLQLKENSNFNICILSNIRDQFLPWDDYFEIIRRSRIVFNFSESHHMHQFKGRVVEALFANCLLLEHVESPISRYLTPGLHYTTYSSPRDLINKICYYVKNPSIAEKIASNGREFALRNFTSTRYWNALLHK